MKVLIACEFSGIVREAFKAKGHDAWSCDLLDTEIPGQHIKGDVLEILDGMKCWKCDGIGEIRNYVSSTVEGWQSGKCRVCDGTGLIKWDLMIAHPPCTYLTVSANKWYSNQPVRKSGVLVGEERIKARQEALNFFMKFVIANVPKIAIENPIGIMSTWYKKPTQIIQPWQFGHPETKATCLWLQNLPLLIPTNIVPLPDKEKDRMKMHYLPKTADRWKIRSRTYIGIAKAMATQWG